MSILDLICPSVIDVSDSRSLAGLPRAPRPIDPRDTDCSSAIHDAYQWASEEFPDGVTLRFAPRTYRCSLPLTFDAGHISICGSGRTTRLVCPGVVWGPAEQRTWLADLHSLQIVSPEFFAGGQDAFPSFNGTGLHTRWASASHFHDIRSTGFAIGYRFSANGSRNVFERLRSDHARKVGFWIDGADTPSSSGNAWLVDNRYIACETDSNWDKRYLTEYGWHFSGTCAGDQFLHMCGALSCEIGVKVSEPKNPGGYRLNINMWQCFVDYCRTATLDLRGPFGEFLFGGGFLGVTGMVAQKVDRLTIALNTIGAMRGTVPLDGINATECKDLIVAFNRFKEFDRSMHLNRSERAQLIGNHVRSIWDGSPTTPGGHGIRIVGGGAHSVMLNVIDPVHAAGALIVQDGGTVSQFAGNLDDRGRLITPVQTGVQIPI